MKPETVLIQLELELVNSFSRMVTWVPYDKRLAKDKIISLEGVPGKWRILTCYRGFFNTAGGLKSDWKVGGLK